RADLIPLEIGGIALTCHADLLAVDDKSTFPHLHHAAVATVRGVILQHVRHVIRVQQIVNANNLNVVAVLRGAEDHSADAAKAIDANLDGHFFPFSHFLSSFPPVTFALNTDD
ncbi:ribosomal protein L35a, partial [Trypanosoma cruzi]